MSVVLVTGATGEVARGVLPLLQERFTLRLLSLEPPGNEPRCVQVDRLASPGTALFYNLGTGTPTSVREVIDAVEKVTGKRVPVVVSPRRAGDPPALCADAGKARVELCWRAQYPDIEPIVASAWHRRHPAGYGDKKHHEK
jgi:nucleoside-diphosphate-sugar epimerase